ncbi:RNA recognition motif domain-containing protein, partial [Undibacterium sp. RuTC16W]|uniref:RNA recognition motif domain-containing protein n=1 Tax=Undibacterium sp. RuTC16W TaxID=3413048 RepID=UPI003BF30C92
MEAKLYVGNLPYSTVDADLESLFSQAGTGKSAQVIKDRVSGRSKGFAFVEMSSAEEA